MKLLWRRSILKDPEFLHRPLQSTSAKPFQQVNALKENPSWMEEKMDEIETALHLIFETQ